ncbi:hypothetical protein L2D14_03090 [Thalassospiraceae bacterium LMO-JJ14]|nr:hypothetical protein L2D14_03090 [Thalassospiraceae bacterium LMO-JJ14]
MSYRQWEIAGSELSELQLSGLEYWRSLPAYKNTGIPLTSSFDLMRLPATILPTTHIVDVINNGQDFRYRFWGSGFRAYLGYDGTGISTETLLPVEIREPVRKAYADVVRARAPLAMLSEFARGGNLPRQGFQRFIRFPLVDETGNVKQVVSLVEFLINNHQAQQLIEDLGKQVD